MKKSVIIELILFVVLSSILGYYGLKIFKHTFDIGTTYHLQFTDIDSIAIGSPVRIMGVDVGHVTKIKGTSDKIYVDFVIPDESIKIPNGTTATIAFFGIAGSRSIELMPPGKNSTANGIVVSDPIRIGSALAIVGEFIRVSMISIGGLYEFAKDKTQDQVTAMTQNFLYKTTSGDDKIVGLTNHISDSFEKARNGVRGTTTGMGRVYSDTSSLNISHNVNIAKYATNFSKRSLLKFKRDIETFENKSIECSDSANSACKAIQHAEEKTIVINNNINSAFKIADEALTKFDNNMTQENLDNVYNKIDEIRIKTEKLSESF